MKVREWIYFARKSTKQEGSAGESGAQQRGQAANQHRGQQADPHKKAPEIVISEERGIESYNRFNHLKDGASGSL